MIAPNLDIEVRYDEQGGYFHSNEIDLDAESASTVLYLNGVAGVVEFRRRSVRWNPPFGQPKHLTADEFIQAVEQSTSE